MIVASNLLLRERRPLTPHAGASGQDGLRLSMGPVARPKRLREGFPSGRRPQAFPH